MDLHVYARVLWRFRLLVLAGLLLAVVVAFLSMAKVSFGGGWPPKVSYRKSQIWLSQSSVFITQKGFPWGRTIYPLKAVGTTGTYITTYADAGRFSGLAQYYAQLASSDSVRARMLKEGPLHGTIGAEAGFDEKTRAFQPFVRVSGISTQRAWAIALANRAAKAIRSVVQQQQIGAKISPKERVVLQIFSVARDATVVQGRKKTIPIVIFLTVLMATLGLAFVLENLRPRISQVEGVAEVDQPAIAAAAGLEADQPAAARTKLRA